MHPLWKINFIEQLNKDFKLETWNICKKRERSITSTLKRYKIFQQRQAKNETRIGGYLMETSRN